VCSVLVDHAVRGLSGAQGANAATWQWAAAGGALFLLAGLWTPVTGVLVGIVELWVALSQSGDRWTPLLVAALGLGLAMLGPGAWSVDARLCGRKRIDIRPR